MSYEFLEARFTISESHIFHISNCVKLIGYIRAEMYPYSKYLSQATTDCHTVSTSLLNVCLSFLCGQSSGVKTVKYIRSTFNAHSFSNHPTATKEGKSLTIMSLTTLECSCDN